MSLYFIDLENVHADGLLGASSLKEGDRVIVFYSQSMKNMPMDRHIELINSDASFEYLKTTKIAKNYLDFQLTTYLGYTISLSADQKVFIISKDTGFDAVVDFWKARGIDISRKTSLGDNVKSSRNANKKQKANRNVDKDKAVKNEADNASNKEKAVKDNLVQENSINIKADDNKSAKKNSDTKELDTGNISVNLNSDINGNEIDFIVNYDSVKTNTESELLSADETKMTEKVNENTSVKKPDTSKNRNKKQKSSKNIINEIETNKAADEALLTTTQKTATDKPVKAKKTVEKTSNKNTSSEKNPSVKATSATSFKSTDLPQEVRNQIKVAIKEEKLKPTQYTVIYKAFLEYTDKARFNTFLVKTFGQEKANSIYKSIKKIFADFLKSRAN